MNLNLDTRETKLTDAEFNALARNTDGDVINLSLAYPFITAAQRERLTGDDSSRMFDLDEELECLYREALAEFA
jgi:hypothetical protein